MKRTLITAALPYANGHLHLGHCAGAYLPADMYARFIRLNGIDALFVCGSDEHGVAITISAEKEKTTPQHIIDKYHTANKLAFERFGMSFDVYSRTSLPEHHQTAQEFFLDWLEKGLLTERESGQFYDAEAAMFLPDRYVEGECPNCGFDKARGDQCDNCGAYYDQTELKNPKSLVSGKSPEIRMTKHWYFRLGEFQESIEQYIEEREKNWKDNVVQQTRSWLKQGLADRAATRDLTWGVTVPVADAEKKSIYVWFEAVLGYISATKVWANEQSKPDEWKLWWQNSDTRYIAFLGKDNIVFHTIIFPILLKSRGNYILPDNVPANEFLNLEGQKFSKSRNWGIDLQDYQQDFPSDEQTDVLRYVLAANLPETRDSDFLWKDYQAKVNNELAAALGNFVNRVVQFIQKNFDGNVPDLPTRFAKLPESWALLIQDFDREELSKEASLEKYASAYLRYFSEHDSAMIAALYFGSKDAAAAYQKFRFRDAVLDVMNIARAANKYFNDSEPWKTIKTDRDLCAKTLYVCIQIVASLGVYIAPILPFTAKKIGRIFGRDFLAGEVTESKNKWSESVLPLVSAGIKIEIPPILFSKVEDSVIDAQIQKLGGVSELQKSSIKTEIQENDGLISIDEFKNTVLRTALVIAAERLPKSEKLLKLIVRLSDSEERQILAGIAKQYSPEDIIGKTVVVVANLRPAKLMGYESQGMLLAANMQDGSLSLIVPDRTVPPGAEVR